MDDELNETLQDLTSEMAYMGERLTEISKCLKKMSNWTEADEAKYGDNDEDSEDDEDEDEDEE